MQLGSFANTTIILIQLRALIHIRFTKLLAIDVKIWIIKLSLRGFCKLIPFCKTVTQMNGLNMIWMQIKTTAMVDIANCLLYHRAVGTSGLIPPPQTLVGMKGKPSLSQGLEFLLPSSPKFFSSGLPTALPHKATNVQYQQVLHLIIG